MRATPVRPRCSRPSGERVPSWKMPEAVAPRERLHRGSMAGLRGAATGAVDGDHPDARTNAHGATAQAAP